MNDPRRLVDLEQGRALELLRAAQEVSTAPAGALERVMSGLALSPASASAAAVSSLTIAKWIGVGVVVGVTGSGVLVTLFRPAQPAAVTAPAGQALPSQPSSAQLVPPPPVALVVTEPAPPRGNASAARTTAPNKPADGTLSAEIAQLERARSELERGQALAALTELDEYAARFRAGQLAPEATLLRVRALASAGRTEAARQLASEQLRRSTDAAHAARLREAAGLALP